ncbi:MAG: DUF2914 domain-containing protein [Deltaproteobacteria bacterium]|nr:DUF2914 domain-containing protein [Deltaproteobacteria bacterium]
MLKKILILLVVSGLLAWTAAASTLRVADAAITTAIKQQMPVDRLESFPAGYGKLFCFTRIVGAKKATHVTHVWYYRDDELARVDLPVGSADWRTYSSKRFLPQWAGPWRVVILDEDGRQLATVPFVLE